MDSEFDNGGIKDLNDIGEGTSFTPSSEVVAEPSQTEPVVAAPIETTEASMPSVDEPKASEPSTSPITSLADIGETAPKTFTTPVPTMDVLNKTETETVPDLTIDTTPVTPETPVVPVAAPVVALEPTPEVAPVSAPEATPVVSGEPMINNSYSPVAAGATAPVVAAAPVTPVAPVAPVVTPAPTAPAGSSITATPMIPVAPVTETPVAAATAAPVVAASAISEKEAKIKAKTQAKQEKKNQKDDAKRAKEQELLNQCPKVYKPLSTAAYFWLGFFSLFPCLGPIFTLIMSFASANRNLKRFERAILIWYVICLIISIIFVILGIFLFEDIAYDILDLFTEFIEGLASSFSF